MQVGAASAPARKWADGKGITTLRSEVLAERATHGQHDEGSGVSCRINHQELLIEYIDT